MATVRSWDGWTDFSLYFYTPEMQPAERWAMYYVGDTKRVDPFKAKLLYLIKVTEYYKSWLCVFCGNLL